MRRRRSLIPRIVFKLMFSFILRNALSTYDCFELGKELILTNDYSYAIEWLTEALRRFDDYYDMHETNVVDIMETLTIAYMKNNQHDEADKVIERIFRINSHNLFVKNHKFNAQQLSERFQKPKNNISIPASNDICYSSQILSININTCPI